MKNKTIAILIASIFFLHFNPVFVISQEESSAQQQEQNNHYSAEEIIKKAITAIGPQDKLEKIKGYQVASFINNAEGDLICLYSLTIRKPDFAEEKYSYGTGKNLMRTYDGEVVSIIKDNKNIDDKQELSKVKIYLEEKIKYLPFHLYYFYKDKDSSYSFVGKERVGDYDCFIIEFIDKDGFKERFFIDQHSYLIIKTMEGNINEQSDVYSDYRDVDGVYTAFLFKTYNKNQLSITIEISDVSFFY